MDLRLNAAVPATTEEQAAVASVLGPAEGGWDGGQRTEADGHASYGGHAARGRRHLLLPALHAVQERIGWISPGALDYVCARLTIPPAEAYGVASFYALFRTTPAPTTVVHVCDDIACQVNGAERLCADLELRFGGEGSPADGPPSTNGSSPNGSVSGGAGHNAPAANGSGVTAAEGNGATATGAGLTWQRSPCLGQCDRGSAVLIQHAGPDAARLVLAPVDAGQISGPPTLDPNPDQKSPESGAEMTETDPESDDPNAREPFVPQLGGDRGSLRLLSRLGQVDPLSLDSYRAAGGYEMLRRAVALGPLGVIREVKDAKLLGRGGAAFPTAVKWEAVTANPVRPHYVVCNADESEPGTFKDRVLMEQDPYALVEALAIMGFACGAEQGYIYIRGEYPLAEARLRAAVESARARGLLGSDVMGAGFAFDVEVRRGAGAYIAGEETALINSIEGKRAEPRNKPPFPAQSGLFGKPTAINNVETMLCVLEILRIGGAAFAQLGTKDSTGTRLFCLSGCVERPGLYEYEFGVTLRDVIDAAGGVRGGRPLQAVLLGGAAGAFVGPDALDVPLTFEGVRAIGATLGSGVVLVLDDTVDVAVLLGRIARFFRDESCGQCVPCRVGTVRQEELIGRMARGAPLGSPERELALLDDIAAVARDASICGLGQTAVGAAISAVRLGLIGANGSEPNE
ncbi:MAG TPA: NAD(P)H-dependent oxidoreductase subunit E [Streptosporangiaceae bacterium]|nr:NAD(P)H-dependent oxidoreductase subunit E [Streptosporangiaceae bacterium]